MLIKQVALSSGLPRGGFSRMVSREIGRRCHPVFGNGSTIRQFSTLPEDLVVGEKGISALGKKQASGLYITMVRQEALHSPVG